MLCTIKYTRIHGNLSDEYHRRVLYRVNIYWIHEPGILATHFVWHTVYMRLCVQKYQSLHPLRRFVSKQNKKGKSCIEFCFYHTFFLIRTKFLLYLALLHKWTLPYLNDFKTFIKCSYSLKKSVWFLMYRSKSKRDLYVHIVVYLCVFIHMLCSTWSFYQMYQVNSIY